MGTLGPVALADEHRRSYSSLRRTAARLVSWGDTEDMVQDAFVRALERRDSFRHDAALSTWLHRIVINRCLDLRRRQRRAVLPLDAVPAGVCVAAPDDRCAVRSALAALRVEERSVCVLYDVLGMTHAEIARRLGIPVGTSKSRLCIARRRLREIIAGATPR